MNLKKVVLVLFLVPVLAEVLLRIAFLFEIPSLLPGMAGFVGRILLIKWEGLTIFQKHPHLAYITKPGVVVTFRTPDYTFTFRTENIAGFGFRDERAERYCAVFVGDSIVFCHGVERENCFVDIFERFSGCNVLNAGVPGYGLYQKILLARELEKLLDTDLFVIFLHSSDPADDIFFFKRELAPPFHPIALLYRKKYPLLLFDLTADLIGVLRFLSLKPQPLPHFPNPPENSVFVTIRKADAQIFGKFLEGKRTLSFSIPERFFWSDGHLKPPGNLLLAKKLFEALKVK